MRSLVASAFVLAIMGAVASAPCVGMLLVTLGLLDSFLLFFGIW